MTKERKRPAIMESHPVTCTNCGHVTNISYNRRRDEPRLCRHCGATIAEPPTEAQPMSAEKTAEAFRILGVHSAHRLKLAEALLQANAPWTHEQLVVSTGIPRTKVYYVTEPLRDLNILQTIPGSNTPTRYTYSETALIHAIIKKADAERDQILSVLQETPP